MSSLSRFVLGGVALALAASLVVAVPSAQQTKPAKPPSTKPTKPPAARPQAPNYDALPPSQIGIGTLARTAYLIDAVTDTVLLFKDADQRTPPSSMAKMMTVYILFEELKAGRLKLDSKFRVSERARSMGGSRMFVELGSEIAVDDLIKGIIVGQRRLRGDRRRAERDRGQFRRAHDQEGARSRHGQHRLPQRQRLAGRRPVQHDARSRRAGAAHHRRFPGVL
jgi:hypothetical protein